MNFASGSFFVFIAIFFISEDSAAHLSIMVAEQIQQAHMGFN